MATADDDAASSNPFPGLRPFREDEQHLFFGRENQIDAMVDKLAQGRFLAVVGSSGSGKSSLVNCGLRPALRQGLMDSAGSAWRMVQFRPKGNPLQEMAAALAEDGVLFDKGAADGMALPAFVEATLRISKIGLIDIVQQAALEPGVNLLVVVDQFEELFRYRQAGAGEAERADAVAFVNLLLEARASTERPIYIVLTMRSDFLGECTQFPGLAEAINAGQYLVPRMTRDERRLAITGPVGVGGAEIEPVLVTRLVNDVGENPDQLSILQHALNRTWFEWEEHGGRVGRIGLPHYEATGTMEEALNRHAERVFDLLDAAQQRTGERLFKALTDRGTDARGIRRPTRFRELLAITQTDRDALLAVMAVFRKPSRSFLMPPQREPVGDDTYVDISHESLMRLWKRLSVWGQEEADSAQLYRRLSDAAAGYAKPEPEERLWEGPKLQRYLDWRARTAPTEAWAHQYGGDFAAAMRFLDESEAQRTRLQAEQAAQREAQRQAEAAAQAAARERDERRSRQRRRVVGATMASLVAALVLTVWWANDQAEQAALATERAKINEALRSMVRQSKGAEALRMPDLTGLDAEAARARLKALNLPGDAVHERSVVSGRKPDEVLAQFPEEGDDLVPKSDRVFLVLATTQQRLDDAARRNRQEAAALAKDGSGAVVTAASAPAGQTVASPPDGAGVLPTAPAAPSPSPGPVAVGTAPPVPPPAAVVTAERPPAAAPAATKPPVPVPVAATPEPPPVAAAACRTGAWTAWMDGRQLRDQAEARKPLYPMSIEGRVGKDNQLEFRAIFDKAPPRGFNWDVFRADVDVSSLRARRLKDGYALGCEQWFIDPSNQKRWQFTWVKR